MRKVSLLLAMTAVMSGCQTLGPDKNGAGHSSLYDGNRSVLYQARKADTSAEQAMVAAGSAYRAGDRDRALFLYLRAADLDPKLYEALVWVGRIHRERGNDELAEMAFADVLGKDPSHVEALTELGLLHLARRNQEKAEASLLQAQRLDQQRLGVPEGGALDGLRVDGQSPLKLYNGLGVLADLRNDFARAEVYYRLALQIEPRSALVQNSLGYSYYLAGHWEQAERAYRRGISYDDGYKPLWRNYGLLLSRMGRYEEAISAFEHVGKRAEASNDVGYICMIEGRFDLAEQFFRTAIEQSPSHYDAAWQNLDRLQQLRRMRDFGIGQAGGGEFMPSGSLMQ
ncbi:tetratricopeptide repeat protein [Azotobacter salinestris]|uniref:tetratricopeptide repeat protein n=1 Tax=Azotobacter salinestris TaxID=69964 RepID=UPI0032DF77A7